MTMPGVCHDACAVCGAVSEQTHIVSNTIVGPPDLDGRSPLEMGRFPLDWWMHRCPHCGYCAVEISEAAAGAGEAVRSEAYRQQLADPLMPDLARSFLCSALVANAAGGPGSREVVSALLCAAWVCDDAGDAPAAVRCRARAASVLEALRAAGGSYADNEPSADDSLLADLYRRAGRFEEAGAAARAGLRRASTAFSHELLELQLRLVSARDTAAHDCDEVVADQGE